jgi:hypothetical protein
MSARYLPVPTSMKERAMISRQQKLIYLPLFGITLLCSLFGVYLFASKRRFSKSKSIPSNRIVKHSVEAPSDDALAYWTTDKMRNAKAVPLPKVNALDQEKHGSHQD